MTNFSLGGLTFPDSQLSLRFGVDSLQQVVVGAFNGDGDLLGTPIRFHLTGSGKIAADFPGVDSQFFATDENNVITNG